MFMVRVAQWIARLPPEQKVAGSTPASDTFFYHQVRVLCFEKSQFSSEKKREQSNKAPMAQWIRRLPTEQEIPGSSPGRSLSFYIPTISSGAGPITFQPFLHFFARRSKAHLGAHFFPFFRVTAFLAEWLRRWT